MGRVLSGADSSHGRGSGARGSGGRGCGYRNRIPNTHGTPATTPMPYQLHDTPDTPESIDSVGTSIPNDASLSVTLAAEAAAAEVRAANARAEATAAAEIAAAAATAAAAAIEAQAVADAAQAAAVVAQANENNEIHDEYPNADKILIHVVPGRIPRFQPSTASRMGKIFKLKVDLEGSNWTKVTQAMKEFYWEEFKKYFIWQRGTELAVKECWRKVVGKRYRDFINDRKSDSVARDYIPPAVWNKWKADWNTPEALELSQKKRLARMGVNGQCSKHTGGSITASEHAIRFEVKNKRKPTCNELFELMHMRKKEKTFVDEKSAAINAAFEAKKLELSLMSSNESSSHDEDAIFMEVVGGMNKEGSIYGLGSHSSSFLANSTSSSASTSTLPHQVSISMLQEIIERALTDYGLETDENVGRRIGKAVESRMGPYERALLQMQNLLASLTNSLQGRVPNFERVLTSEDDVDDEELREDDLNDD